MLNKRLFIIFFIIISSYFIFPAKLQFDIKLGYGGYSVPGYWIPLYIKINQDIKFGRIEIQKKNNSSIFLKEFFPCKKNNTIEYPVLFDENITDIVISLFSENDLLIEKTIKVNEKIFPGHIILTNNMNSKTQQALTHTLFPEEPIQVISVNLEDLTSVALNYDCVSVIVMPDPGITITPAQINALKYWIAGGGQLILSNQLPESNSILNKFNGDIIIKKNYKIKNTGFGKIFAFEDAISSESFYKSENWQKLLKLKPYVNNPRLRPAKILKFENYIPSSKKTNSSLKKILLIGIISWGIIFLIILLLTKKNFLILSVFTILSLIILIPYGNHIKKDWQGGASYHNRMIILPGNNGFLINSKIWFPKAFNNDFYYGKVPLELNVSEKIFLNPKNEENTIFIHNINKPEFALQNNNKIINLVAYKPFDIIEDEFLRNILIKNNNDIFDINGINFQNKKNLALIKGKKGDIELFEWDTNNYKWKKNKLNLTWLDNDLEWITQLKNNQSDTDWLIGLDDLSELKILLQDELCPRILWALPVKI